MIVGVFLGIFATLAVVCCALTIAIAVAVHVAGEQLAEPWWVDDHGDPSRTGETAGS